MFLIESAVLGIVQGLAEFLPISSSAHLTLLPLMFNWQSPLLNSLAYDVALHAGTLVALLIYFRQELWGMVKGLADIRRGQGAWNNDSLRLVVWLIIGTVPAVIAAMLWEDQIKSVFRSPVAVAVCLIVFGIIMAMVEYFSGKRRDMAGMGWPAALGIGLAQALALMPGVSRSGSTLTAGLLLGFKREEAARFSFLLSIPATAGALVFELKDLLGQPMEQNGLTLLVGMLAAGISGFLCIQFLLAYLKRSPIYIFVAYRLVFGGAVLFWWLR